MDAIEAKIGRGQVEELIVQVKECSRFSLSLSLPLYPPPSLLLSLSLSLLFLFFVCLSFESLTMCLDPIHSLVYMQAQDELALAKSMLSWKAWEPLEEHPPQDQWKWPVA